MIKIDGNYYKLKSSNDEILSIVKDSSIKAYQAIDHFFDVIELNKELFSHLKDIDITIDNNKSNGNMAAYFIVRDSNTKEPMINLIAGYIDKNISLSKTDGKYNSSLCQIAWSIIHETIHCNRCIMIKDRITVQDTGFVIDENINKFKKTYNHVEDLLSKYYNPNKMIYFFDILKIVIDDKYIDVYVYNEKEDRYEFYLFDKLNISGNNVLNDIKLLLYLNYKNKCIFNKPYGIIKRFNSFNEEDMCMNFSNNSIDFPFDIDTSKKTKDIILLNEGLEESITEAFAGLITIMNEDKYLNIYEACDTLYYLIDNYDIKLAIDLIRNMNMDDIRWFFVSCYLDEYENRFNNIIKKDYDRLLICFDKLYKTSGFRNNSILETYYEGRYIIYQNSPYKQLKK